MESCMRVVQSFGVKTALEGSWCALHAVYQHMRRTLSITSRYVTSTGHMMVNKLIGL